MAVLYPILFILADNDNIHESLNEFESWLDPTTGFHGNRYCYNLKSGVATFFTVVVDGILFILTGNDDIHKSLDEFEIQPDPTTDHRGSCPSASEKLMFPFFPRLV